MLEGDEHRRQHQADGGCRNRDQEPAGRAGIGRLAPLDTHQATERDAGEGGPRSVSAGGTDGMRHRGAGHAAASCGCAVFAAVSEKKSCSSPPESDWRSSVSSTCCSSATRATISGVTRPSSTSTVKVWSGPGW